MQLKRIQDAETIAHRLMQLTKNVDDIYRSSPNAPNDQFYTNKSRVKKSNQKYPPKMPPSITELSERIARNTAIVEKWLANKGARMPSFEQDADDEFPDTAGELEIEAARNAVIDDTSALHDLLLGPREGLARVWGAVS